MEEVFEEAVELDNQEELMNEMMNKYGQDILRLVYSYVYDIALKRATV